jgi:hypothetical protein
VAVVAGPAGLAGQGFRQTQSDDYTRYELSAPGTAAFRIHYDVSATTAGATFYFNTIRQGAEEEVHGVRDLMSGTPLEWRVVDGAEARASGMQNASAAARYIAIRLARPVPPGGQARIRIDKTYVDTASYRLDGDRIVFERSLGIDRNAIVLPPGYELTSCNFPVQVVQEGDGRIRLSFMNAGPAAVPLRVEGRVLRAATREAGAEAEAFAGVRAGAEPTAGSGEGARVDYRFTERAFENRDIAYFLQQPETHSFRLYHDYTEMRPGVDRYVNVVRAGSRASEPAALILDTGERLRVETLRGDEITRQGIDAGPVTAATEVVVIRFDPVPAGGSVRLRIEETYTDPGRYVLSGPELIWDRTFGRPRNTVVLPEGWYLTANSIPAVVTETADGRIRLRYINDRPDEIRVFIRAKRR